MSVLIADEACKKVQEMVFKKTLDGAPVNSFEPRKIPGRQVRQDGILYVSDICYDREYPNSYFDIWYPDENIAAVRPTVVYFHGGGFIFGDKITGDPMAEGAEEGISFYTEIVRRGFNLISANYCFAPEYRYPKQIDQINRLMKFLGDNYKSYGLDMDRVVISGSSAGADLAQIYGMILSDREYAELVDIEPAISWEQVKALIIDESALGIQNFLNDKNMVMMTQTWLGTSDLKNSAVVRELDLAAAFQGDYLPSYIIASNREPWFGQWAEEFVHLLKSHNIQCEYYYRDKSCDDLEHGFMQRFASNPYAKECFEGMISFIQAAV